MFTPTTLPLQLPDNTVHIWYFKIDSPIEQAILSSDEQARANRLRIETRRRQFITTRHITRVILASYLQTTPESIHFVYNEHGKPLLSELNFNLSHTDNHAVLAISRNALIGVDIEQIRIVESYDFIRETAFTELENTALDQLPAEDRELAFWRCWTRKEALMKGLGIGFRIAKQVTVSLDETPQIIHITPENEANWHLHEYRIAPNLLISLAINAIMIDTYRIQTLIYDINPHITEF